MTKHLFFQVAGTRYALLSKHVKAVHAALTPEPVAGTHDWFLGLAVCEGRLLPVTDLGLFSGLRPSSGSSVELDHAVALAALKIDKVTGAAADNVAPVHGSDSSVTSQDFSEVNANSLREFVTGELISDNGLSHHVLDVLTLVKSERFINIRESI